MKPAVLRRVVLVWVVVLVLHGLGQAASIWADGKRKTPSTTMVWADGGTTTIYGPPQRDGAIYTFR